jgi:hypothetical protein
LLDFSVRGKGLFGLALGEDDDSYGSDEKKDAEDLEWHVVVGEKGVPDEVNVGEFALGQGSGDFAVRNKFASCGGQRLGIEGWCFFVGAS